MALLIQRVSGSYRNGYFFPDLAGVGLSRNTFVWKRELDPSAGMIRLVFGLGTRAVNRVDDDYPRVVALDAPLLRPLSGMEDIRKYSQQRIDLLDIKDNLLRDLPVRQVLAEKPDINLDLIATRDVEITRKLRTLGKKEERWLLTFEKLLSETPFTEVMRRILRTLESHYEYPVDIEFTVNFARDQTPVINLLQCRPLQTKGQQVQREIPSNVEPEKIFFSCEGYFMGGSISEGLSRIIYVEPRAYVEMPLSQKYDIARLVGKLNRQIANRETEPTILLGPGRWGTTTPSLGIPVGFHEINNVTVLVEIAYEGGNLMPELSFGTHFFQDLVEADIFYVALFPKKENVLFSPERLGKMPNLLGDLVPESTKYADVVKVCDVRRQELQIICDVLSQKVLCAFK
jgi:hypothetical protein